MGNHLQLGDASTRHRTGSPSGLDLSSGQKAGLTTLMEPSVVTRLREIIADPREARIAFMPIVDLETSRIWAFEALAELGVIGIDEDGLEWVDLAANAGLIAAIDRIYFVKALEGYCLQRAFLSGVNQNPNDLRITINLHPRTLDDPTLAAWLLEMIIRHGLTTKDVIIEITEHAPLEAEAQRQIVTASHRGFAFFLDDFGDGSPRWRDLSRLSIQGVKFGIKSTSNIGRDDRFARLRETIIQVKGRRRGLIVIAEGTENGCQMETFYDLQATHVQGFCFGKKCTCEASIDLLRENLRLSE